MPGTPARSRGRQAGSALLGMLAVAVIAGVMVAVAVTPAIALTGSTARDGLGLFGRLPSDLEIAPLDQRTEVYAKDGDADVLIASFYAQNREVVGAEQVSDVVRNAAIAGEDVRYYEHGAVDPVGIVRAGVSNLLGQDLQGASTITQQYVKNVCVQQAEQRRTEQAVDSAYEACTDASIGRKLREARLAIALEKRYSKDRILLGYLNIAGFGGRTYGIQAAAKYYFDTTSKDLTPAQAASLMAIVNNPETLRLDDEDNLARNTERRDYILGVELRNGMITREEHDEAVATETEPDITPTDAGCRAAGVAGFFCDYVRRTVLTDEAFGGSAATRAANLQRSGYKIYTTLDIGVQREAQRTMNESVPKSDPVFDVGAAASSVEVGTGRIVTMVQNKRFSDSAKPGPKASAVNFNANRTLGESGGFQPGSTFKVFTLLQWLKDGRTLNESVDSDPGTKPASSFTACGEPYQGEDWTFGNDEGDEGGSQTILNGTARSINGTFASMAQQLDLCDIQQTAEDFGIEPVSGTAEPRTEAPFVIGGAYTVAPVAMAAAYAAIANGGVYCSPVAVDRVVKSDGTELPVPAASCRRVVDEGVADAAVYALRGVMQGGTASGDNTPDGVFEFGKTGTTDEAVQTWMIGSTSEVTTAAWVGNVQGAQSLREASFPDPCYTSGVGLASDARHCVWQGVQTAVNAEYGGDTSWAEPDAQYLYGTPTVEVPDPDAETETEGVVPDVTGLTKPAASEALVAAGYAWAYGADVESDAPAGSVVSTEPAAGTALAPGTQVVVHGSTG